MPDNKHPKCDHPKCGAKMQRLYKRQDSRFVSIDWVCVDYGMFQRRTIRGKQSYPHTHSLPTEREYDILHFSGVWL